MNELNERRHVDIWHFDAHQSDTYVNYVCIPTNGFVTASGKLVMGAGLARQARDKFEGLDERLGALVRVSNVPHALHLVRASNSYFFNLISVPTKPVWSSTGEPGWKAPSDLALILNSLHILAARFGSDRTNRLVFPRLGCGYGGLSWEAEVRPAILQGACGVQPPSLPKHWLFVSP